MARRPLLTDDIVDDAKRRRQALEEDIRLGMQEDTGLAKRYDEKERALKKNAVYKSRRIENAKTRERGKHLNLYLSIASVVLLVMIWYIIFVG